MIITTSCNKILNSLEKQLLYKTNSRKYIYFFRIIILAILVLSIIFIKINLFAFSFFIISSVVILLFHHTNTIQVYEKSFEIHKSSLLNFFSIKVSYEYQSISKIKYDDDHLPWIHTLFGSVIKLFAKSNIIEIKKADGKWIGYIINSHRKEIRKAVDLIIEQYLNNKTNSN